jgi:predicted metal-dependent hydrolase
VLVGDERIEVAVRESARARRARLVVHQRRAPEVVVPVGASDSLVDGLLAQNRAWLARALARARAQAARGDALGLDRSGLVWLDGVARPVSMTRAARSSARLTDAGLRVAAPDAEAAAAAVARWYRHEARDRIDAAVAREAARLGLDHGRVSVRDQRTRWGSCSRSGALSFNWRLALAPPAVLDYVVVHELCHLRRHDHSPAFWALVASAQPDWEPRARWLKQHGSALLAYEPAAAVR